MKNLHLLPTDKQSKLYLDSKKNICITDVEMQCGNKQNIYITSDEEIKVKDWFMHSSHEITNIYKEKSVVKESIITTDNNGCWIEYFQKIILTTDEQLIKEGVQAIDNEFLEWFVKNSSCEEVEVELFPNFSNKLYGIIIPKEEPKQETLEEAAEKATFNPSLSWESEFAKEKFIEGAKWQQKRSYSEDEVLQLLRESHFVEQNIEEWFNQNKK